jgi:hypothetical protein
LCLPNDLPDDGGSKFLRNASQHLPNCTAHPTTQPSS